MKTHEFPFYINGTQTRSTVEINWLNKMLGNPVEIGKPIEPVLALIDSVELEDNYWYFNTLNGVTVSFYVSGIYPPWPERKMNDCFAILRNAICTWAEKMDTDAIETVAAMNKHKTLRSGNVTAINHYVIALGHINGSKRAFDEYMHHFQRKREGKWLPEEIPLCPQCREQGLFYGEKQKDFCHRHHWFDKDVYQCWHYTDTGTIAVHMAPLKIGWKRPEVIKDTDNQPKHRPDPNHVPTPETGLFLKCTRPPVDEIPAERLEAFGNHLIAQYNAAKQSMETADFHKTSPELKAWAGYCLDELKQYIEALRKRKASLKDVEKMATTTTPHAPSKKRMTGQQALARAEFLMKQIDMIDEIWTPEKQAAADPGELAAVMARCSAIWSEYGVLCQQIPKELWP